MTDLAPAFARLAALRRQMDALDRRERRELVRLRRIGQQELDRVLRPLKLQKGRTILKMVHPSGFEWTLGIYRGAAVTGAPRRASDSWNVVIYLRSLRKNDRPGTGLSYRTLSGPTVAEAVAWLRVAGEVR